MITMKIACRAPGTKVPNYNLMFEQADVPIEVPTEVGQELLKSNLFYQVGKKKVIKEENYGSSFSNFTEEEVDE